MAAPMAQLRKQLSAPGLLKTVRRCFSQIPEHRARRPEIPLADALMSGLAVFGLKYPALLQFDQAYSNEATVRHNLKTLYGVERAPCDSQLRTILDPVQPEHLRSAFRAVHREVQRGKALEGYAYLDGHYLISVDGTGQFSSGTISCPECCVKTSRNGEVCYYHQLLAAVIVHPELKTVLPLMPEAITRQDGASKNDCERNASKRLLKALRSEFPQLKAIIVEDSLASNAPHIELLQSLDLRYILGVKPGDHEALFEALRQGFTRGACGEKTVIDEHGVEHGYRWLTDVALNQSSDVRVNVLEYWEIKDGKQRIWSWVTDLELSADTVEAVQVGARTRWKVENETFNTLKNQGYHLEHNYGHGEQHLSTVFATLMMLAFLIDQVQELGCRVFQGARAQFHARTALWERLRAFFTDFRIPDWATLWRAMVEKPLGPELRLDSS